MLTHWWPISAFSRRRRLKRACSVLSTGTGSSTKSLETFTGSFATNRIHEMGRVLTSTSPIASGPAKPADAARAAKLLFLVTEDWYFVSHRLELAVAARQAGYDVVVATRVDRHGERIT